MPMMQTGESGAPHHFQQSGGGFLDPQRIAAGLGIKEGMKIADFGSGSGDFTVELAKAVGENGLVTAVDIIESKLESVRVKAKFAGVSNIETIRSNLEVIGSSGLGDSTQDMTLLINVLFQSTNKPNMLKEAVRVLRAGGKLAVIEWKKGTGGLGPPEELRTDPDAMRDMVVSMGVGFQHEIEAGLFHYGFIFSKPA